MILEKQTESLVMTDGDSKGSIGMTLDLDSANVLMQMLSKNLYTDSIGSAIREAVSNSKDSMTRTGNTDPVIVRFGMNEGGNYEFTSEDFGTGLDDKDVETIISKYGKSTKRQEANSLGMMGLGFKAPLAYSSSFYFVGRKDGMERKWMMYEGEDCNTIDLLFEAPTKEPNGVKVIIPVNYSDRDVFVQKIKEQLAYFENVYFDVQGRYESIQNDFTIHRGEHFQYSELCSDGNMHICLDNVYYPIDFPKLGIPEIRFPVGLRFSLSDGIFPVPSREAIRMTKEAKETILKRIGQVADFFMERYNSTIKETDSVHAIYDYFNGGNKLVDIINEGPDGNIVNNTIEPLVKYASIKMASPTLKDVKLFPVKRIGDLNNFMLKEYSKYWKLDGGRISAVKYGNDITIRDSNVNKFYLCNDKISGLKKDYIKSLHPNSWNIFFIKKNKEFSLGAKKLGTDYSTYRDMIELHKFPKSEWRQLVKEYQYIISLITKNFVNLDEMIIPKEFIEARKIIKEETYIEKRKKLAGEIVGQKCQKLERYVSGKNSKLVREVYDLATMHQNKYISVYGKMEDSKEMDGLFSIFRNEKVKFIVFSEREIKHLEEINVHNWIEIRKFMKGDNISFKRIVTAYLIRELRATQNSVFNKKDSLKGISTKLFNDLEKLEKYDLNWHISGNNDVYKAMLEVANEHNYFDESIYYLYKDVKATLDNLKFLNPILGNMSSYGNKNEFILDAISDLFKYYKQKVNLDRYKLVMNDEIPVDVEVSEELIEELI